MRICVIGPAGEQRERLRDVAAEGGGLVLTGTTPVDCGRMFTEGTCDLVLIDASGETAAISICREIARERNDHRPYILVVNLPPGAAFAALALEAGADDVLSPPLDAARVATRLEVARWRVARRAEVDGARAEAEARYRTLFDQKLDAVFVLDEAGRYLDANEAACAMTGYSREELLSMTAHDVVDPGELAERPFQLPYLAGGGALTGVERRIRRKDGAFVDCETSISGMPDGRILAITRDVSERKRYEAALRDSEARFRAFYEKTPVMLHSIDADGRIVAASDYILGALGYEREEVLGKFSTDFLTPESAERARTIAIPEMLRTGSYWNAPGQMVKRNGELIDILTSSFMLTDEDGRHLQSLAVSIDVTAQRKAERALRDSEERLRLILEACPDLVGWIDQQGRLLFANAAHLPALGLDPAELAGQSMLDFVHPDDVADVVGGMQRLAAGEPTDRDGVVVRFRRADGSWAHLEMRARALRGADGKPTGIIVVSRDVSERLAHEEVIRAAAAFRDLVMESSTNAIYALDLEGRFTFANGRTMEITGFPEAEMIGQPFSELFEPEPLALVSEQFAKAAVQGERVREFEVELRQKNGSHAVITFSIAPLVKDGIITGVVGTAEDITARKRALEALQERERALTTLMANLPGTAYRCLNDRDWTMELLSDGCFALTGYPASGFLAPGGLTLAALMHPDDRDRVWEGVQAAVARRQPFELNYRISTAWGEERRVWERGQGVFDDSGELLALEGFIMDVTERERALTMLHESEERYRRLVELSPNAVVVHQGGTIGYANAEALRLLGAQGLADVAGRALTDFIDLEPLARARAAATEQSEANAAVFVEVQVKRLDGTPLDVELSSGPAMFGGLLATQTVVRDVSERKRAEEALRQSEERYRRLVETAPLAIVVHVDGILQYANATARGMLRLPPGQDVAGMRLRNFVSPDSTDGLSEQREMLRQGVSVFPTEVRRLVRMDGEVYEGELTAAATIFEGRPAVQVVVRDLTDQRRAEEVVRQSSEQYRRLVQMSPVAMAVVQDVRITYANVECLRVFGAPSLEQAAGRHLFDFVADESREEGERWVANFLATRAQTGPFEALARRWNGETFTAEVSAATISYDGAPAVLIVVRDLSEQKRAEEVRLAFERRMLESQKLESLGVLAGGVAHDFNNLLVAIMGNASLSLMEVGESSPLRPYLEDIETAAQRAADLARQMLAYSGKGRLAISSVQLNELVGEMGKLVSVSIPKKVMLEWQLAEGLPPVEADATQLRQVVMNLVINAAEAIGDREGVVRVSTGAVTASRGYLESTFMPLEGIAEGEYVYFEVADTGAGMDRETMERIFEPFFTTKFTGRGLGMAAVLGIVRGHRGAIRVESGKGQGTTIRVLLPPADAAPRTEEPLPAPAQPVASRGRVLVVDDEASIRAVASRMLGRMGFEVVAVADGAAGVEHFRGHHEGLALVLVDLTMPQMGGVEAFAEMQAVSPRIPVVVMSGYSEQETLGMFSGARPRAFLQKPFSLAAVEAALREALAPGG